MDFLFFCSIFGSKAAGTGKHRHGGAQCKVRGNTQYPLNRQSHEIFGLCFLHESAAPRPPINGYSTIKCREFRLCVNAT
jgi:hypothetical protein